jgi:hypothetical protein
MPSDWASGFLSDQFASVFKVELHALAPPIGLFAVWKNVGGQMEDRLVSHFYLS